MGWDKVGDMMGGGREIERRWRGVLRMDFCFGLDRERLC